MRQIPAPRAAQRVLAILTLTAWAAGAHAPMATGAAVSTAARRPARAVSRAADVALCTNTPGWIDPHVARRTAAGLVVPPLAPASSFGADLRVERDAETGEWGLTSLNRSAEPLWAEATALSRSSVGLIEEPLPGGGVRMDLQGRFQSLSVASRTNEGGVRVGCVDGALGLFQWLHEGAPVLDASGRPVR